MTANTDKPIAEFRGFNGLYSRGVQESCPQDHLTDCMNCTFPGAGQVSIREPVTVSSFIATRTIISYFVATPVNGPRLLTLNSDGKFYDEAGPTLLGVFAGADDFVALNIFGRVYISFKAKGKALPGSALYMYDGTSFRPAAGHGDLFGVTLAQVNAGIVDVGVHGIAFSFQSDTGYLSPPCPITTINSTGVNDIEVSNIGTGPPDTVARVILMTKANQTELFFVPLGTIPDNVTTTFVINVHDSALIDSADYLNDILPLIPAVSSIKFYQGRLILVGQELFPDNLLVSRVSDPESFDKVLGVIHFPVDYGLNTCNTALVILGVLYVLKPKGTYSTQDNGNDPSTWAVNVVDSALGAWDNGISLFSSSASAEDVFDSSFIATKRGLMLFQAGAYQPIPFTYKIESIWNLVKDVFFYKVQISHDVNLKRVYIAVHLTPPSAGNSFSPQISGYLLTVLMMDYQEGLSPDKVKWSTWKSQVFSVLATGILKINFENFTLSYSSSAVPIYQLTFCIGDESVYKITAITDYQNYTQVSIPDQRLGSGLAIDQYIIFPCILPPGGGVYTFTMLDFNIYGYGFSTLIALTKSRLASQLLTGFNLTAYIGKDYRLQRLINFTNEGLQVYLNADLNNPGGLNGFFQISSLSVYGTKMWAMRPALVESA